MFNNKPVETTGERRVSCVSRCFFLLLLKVCAVDDATVDGASQRPL